MAISTADSLLALIEKSKLLEPEQLEEVRKTAQEAPSARALAKALIKQDLLTRWQAGQLLAGRGSFHLGKYRLRDLLGRGGMGSVFLAYHTMMNRPVALKIIAKHLGKSRATLDRFFSEARAVAALNHPNIVHAYSIDNEGERYYIVMEFVEGQDLQRMVEKQGPLDIQEAADYIRQAAEGLAHAHSKDIIHCDIKPANLLVNPQGVVKILDMGMARLIAADENNGGPGEEMLGTVDYMSPELALHTADLDFRTDIYSLGCTFYFLLTGHPPFPEGTLAERIVKHQTQQPASIAEQRPETPRELIEICEKMMAKKPGDRFQSAAEISRLLADWRLPERPVKRSKPVDGEPVQDVEPEENAAEDVAATSEPASEETTPTTRKRWSLASLSRRQQIILAVAGGLVLLIVLAVAGVWLFSSGSGPPGQETEIAEGPEQPDTKPAAQGNTAVAKVQDVGLGAPSTDDLAAAIGLDMAAPAEKPAIEASKTTEEPKPAVEPTPKPAEEAPAAAKPAEEKPAEEKSGEAATMAAKPAEEKSTEPKPSEEKPEERPAAEKAPEEKSAEEKPAAEKKPAQKPAQPKAGDPLRDVPPTVTLPLIGEQDTAKDPFELAQVHSAPDVEWQLYLLGGENALGRSRKYVLDQVERDAAKASWAVKLESSASGKDNQPVDVAKLWRESGALMFQWADGISASEANHLRNCILQVRVLGDSRYITLCQPQAVEPIAIDLDRGSSKGGFSLKWLPDDEALRFEITKVDGPEGYQIEPKEPSPAKTPVHLTYVYKDRANNDRPGPKFRIIFQARSSGVSADLRLVESPMNFRQLAMSLRQFGVDGIDGARRQIMDEQAKIEKELANAKGGPRERLDAQLRQLDMNLWYVNFLGEMQAGAAVHYRVFLPVDDKQVVLASTELAQQPDAAPAAVPK